MKIKSKNLFTIFGILFLLLLVSLLLSLPFKKTVHAQSESDTAKYFTSILIEPGDTLWEIAKDNMTEEYKSINQYIDEVKFTNNLYSDDITAGCYLLIPYYATTPRL